MSKYKTVDEIMAARQRGEISMLEAVRMADKITAAGFTSAWTWHDGPENYGLGVASKGDEHDVVSGPSITAKALADEGRE